MTRLERIALLVFFLVLLAGLIGIDRNAAVLGGVAGAGVGVVASGRLRRLSRRMDERLGAEVVALDRSNVRRPATRAVVQLAVLAVVFVSTIVIPFLGDELFAATGAAVTAFPAVVTVARLRR